MHDPSPVATWLPIPGWEGYYEVSDHGQIRSITRTITLSDGRVRTFYGQLLSAATGEWGHQFVRLSHQLGDKMMSVHSAMMAAFVGPRPEGLVVCHTDGNAKNNVLPNLRYDTPRENTLDNVRNGSHHYAKRDECKWLHPFNELNTMPGVGESRNCRACWMAGKVVKNKRAGGLDDVFQAVSDVFFMRVMAGGVIGAMPADQRDQYVQVLTSIGKPPKKFTTIDEVREVIRLLPMGDSGEVIAKKVGISPKTVSQIKIGKHPLHRVSTLRKRPARAASATAQEAS
jgi:HNH endonuclease/NUMOD4 motif